jgi:RNA polymerase sigma-70 factor (ECF subfamily)
VLRDAVVRGDETAWRVLYDRHFEAIHAYVHFKTRNQSELADTLVQECWMIAVRSIRKFDAARASFRTWMRGIADNLLRNAVRKQQRKQAVEGAPIPVADLEIESRDPESFDLRDAIKTAMAALPANYRSVLVAKYRDGLGVNEIAETSGRSPKAIESLLTRAREAFRREYRALEDHG